MSKSVGRETEKVLRQWEGSKERERTSQEIHAFFKESLKRQKAAARKLKKKPTGRRLK